MSGKKTVMMAAIAALLLVACGGKTDEAVESGEIVVPEMSSEDLLVSSLEYLLLDDETEEQELHALETPEKKDQETTDHKNETLGAADNAEASEENQPKEADDIEAPGENQPGEAADQNPGVSKTIYYGNGGSHDLRSETVTLDDDTPDELLGALARHNIVSLDTKILSFKEEEQDGSRVLYLDLSKAANEYLRTMSKEAECIIVASLVNTFVENYDASRIYLTVEGDPLSTANREYAQPLAKCTPAELMEE